MGDGCKIWTSVSIAFVCISNCLKLAHKFAVSQADKFFKSEWDVFVKKLKWGNSVVVAMVALFYWLFLSQPN